MEERPFLANVASGDQFSSVEGQVPKDSTMFLSISHIHFACEIWKKFTHSEIIYKAYNF